MTRHVLTLACPSGIGIVAAVAGTLAAQACNITDAQQFDDATSGKFFMRVEFDCDGDGEALRPELAAVATRFGMTCIAPASKS